MKRLCTVGSLRIEAPLTVRDVAPIAPIDRVHRMEKRDSLERRSATHWSGGDWDIDRAGRKADTRRIGQSAWLKPSWSPWAHWGKESSAIKRGQLVIAIIEL
jgi:hypothetical protein